jgi:predicted nucleic acid-binding protein
MIDVLADASALVPMVDERDQWWLALQRVLRALSAGGQYRLRTTNWTLYEAMALAKRRSQPVANRLYDLMNDSGSIVAVNPIVELEAVRRFRLWADKSASIVDHANALVALQLHCAAIISFDDDFRPLVAGSGIRLLR